MTFEVLEALLAPATFTPSPRALDGTTGSLRADIITANANGQDNIFLLPGGTFRLTLVNPGGVQGNSAATGELDLTGAGHTYTFQGAGAGRTIIKAADADRVFQILPNVSVLFENLTITGGQAQTTGSVGAVAGTTDAWGGGILNSGNLTLENVALTGNAALGGNGVSAAQGKFPAPGFAALGGGIYENGGTLTLNATQISGNSALGGSGAAGHGSSRNGGDGGVAQGGGLFSVGATVHINGGKFSGNRAVGGGGGSGGLGTFSAAGGNGGNGGNAQGGGVYASGGTLNISATPFSHNTAVAGTGGGGGLGGIGSKGNAFAGGAGGNGGLGQGGGLFADSTTLNFSLATLSGNISAGGQGGTGGSGGTGTPAGGAGGAAGSGGAGQGGALFSQSSSRLAISLSAVVSNQAQGGAGNSGGQGGNGSLSGGSGGTGSAGGAGQGGGLFATGNSTLTLSDSTVAENRAGGGNAGSGGHGGSALSRGGAGGKGGVGGSDLANSNAGGGLFVSSGIANIHNSTIAFNTAAFDKGGAGGAGGAGTTRGGTGQSGAGRGGVGGGVLADSHATVNVVSTLIADNRAKPGTGIAGPDVDGVFTDAPGTANQTGFNLIGIADGSTGFTSSTDLLGTATHPLNPRLNAPAQNGGLTPTVALASGSPAFNKGANPDNLGTDQRGGRFVRTRGGQTDIGAYE